MPRNKQNACKYEVWSFHQGLWYIGDGPHRGNGPGAAIGAALLRVRRNNFPELFSQDFQKKLKDLEDAAEELSALCPGEIGLINKDELSKPKAEGKV